MTEFEPNEFSGLKSSDFARSVHEDVAESVIWANLNSAWFELSKQDKIRALASVGINAFNYIHEMFENESDLRVSVIGQNNLTETDSYRAFKAMDTIHVEEESTTGFESVQDETGILAQGGKHG